MVLIGPGSASTVSAGPAPEQGAAVAIRLATLPDDGPSGRFFDDEAEVPWRPRREPRVRSAGLRGDRVAVVVTDGDDDAGMSTQVSPGYARTGDVTYVAGAGFRRAHRRTGR
ncbi:hypothetical protein ACFU3E_06670 [Streptomyces sp. NPDC057424]|uniref:hypothetical protein n=1 Tax=Streptomyces sp. NPDC057424 TaxID=3346127 RepID=UPI0036984CC2